jgi:hypothetical protein
MSLKRWDGTQWVTVAGSRPGPQGPQGLPGTAATVSVGTVTTGASGTSAAVTNSGTSSAAILNFTIPVGPAGSAGTPGAQGTPGQRGSFTYTGIANPTSNNPAQKNGLDTYLNTTTGDYFQYNSTTTTWVLVGNLKGPQGDTGLQGIPGIQGPAGPAGETAVQEVIDRVDAWEIDQTLNLGIYYPKYTTLTNLTMLKAQILATSMVF